MLVNVANVAFLLDSNFSWPQGSEGFQNARRGSSTAGRQAGIAAAQVCIV